MRLVLVPPFLFLAATAGGQQAIADNAAVQADAELANPPVYQGDLDRPYRVIGEIRDNLRKHFAFQADPTQEKIYAELWERGRKMGADAVINARHGATERTMFNHGRTPISGTAVKFLDGKSGP
jgi:hypothetical protein